MKHTNRRRFFALFAVLAIVAGFAAYAGAFSTTWQYFSNPIGDQGTFPPYGSTNPNFASNAPHVATRAEYSGEFLYITSTGTLSGPQPVLLPAIQGSVKDVYNATTGSQAILVGALGSDGGAAGTTVSIPWHTGARVVCYDGTNFALESSAGGAGFVPTGTGWPHITDGGYDDAARAVNLASSDITGTLAHGNGGTDITSPGIAGKYLRSDGTNWTSGSLTAGDMTGTVAHGNGGTDITSPGSAGNYLRSDGTNWTSASIPTGDIPNGPTFASDGYDAGGLKALLKTNEICVPDQKDAGISKTCSTELGGATIDHTTWITIGQFAPSASTAGALGTNFVAVDKGQDAGGVSGVTNCTVVFTYEVASNGVVNMFAQNGAFSSSVLIPLACITPTVGVSDGGSDSGVPSGATSFAFQAINTAGVIAFQVQGPDTHLYGWGAAIQHQRVQ